MNGSGAAIYLMAASHLDRHAYRLLLREHLALEVSLESDFTPVSVWNAMRGRPELGLIFADAPTPDVLEAVQMIPKLHKATRLAVISAVVDPQVVQGWGDCNLDGYVVKAGGLAELQRALERLVAGRSYFSDGVREALAIRQREAAARPRLSRRETELLPLLARGLTLREAATRMTVSYKTADSYRTSLLRKLGIRDRVELARYAIRERIIEP